MVGENVIIKAKFSKDTNKLKIKLLENNSVKLVMNPVFINSFRDKERTIPIREVNWKLESINNGISKVKIKINDKIFEKNLIIGVYKGALSNKKLVKSSLQHFLYPAEGLFEKTEELKSVYIKYPGKNVNFLGIKIHWIILNIIIVVIVVLGFRKKFGIEF